MSTLISYSVRLAIIHGLKVIHGSQGVEREPGNEASIIATVKMHSTDNADH